VSLDPLKCTFLGYYISALRGCCALKLLHALQIEEGLLAHTPRGTGVPLKIFNRENLKSGLKFSVWANKTSGLVKVYSWHFFQSTCRRSGVITRVQFSEGPAPKICESEKNVQNSVQFLTTFDFGRQYLRNRSWYRQSGKTIINYNPFHVGHKKLVIFGPQTTELKWLILTNPSVNFSGDYISAIRGCCPLNFLHALAIDPGYLAHTPNGMGVPHKILIVKI